MTIAVLAWGSLVWKPTNRGVTLQLRSPDRWESDGPWLPVEFARLSADGSLTLVVVPSHDTLVETLWSESAYRDLEPAILNVAGREGIKARIESIHGVVKDGSRIGSVPSNIASIVHSWLVDKPSLDAAIWTGLGTAPRRWREHGYAEGFTPANALSYLRSLSDRSHPAFEYMARAPRQIATPVRRKAEQESII